MMSYWDFFPAEDGWGRVPMWGFAEVERSEADGRRARRAAVRVPAASSHLVVTPADADERGFVDASPHRAALPSAYHRYLATDADPFYRADTEEHADAAASALLHLVPDRRPARSTKDWPRAGRS